ncbi:hypothetical protein K461DRAFT_316457 [Myriangium duriaei CBS 260.36]|uniref:2EXR domain-containing protein n=1 Tax=Myriangium duriaei CBS 260.36 TaxID=1168546 RepID=A0A9P4MCB7_9PEZI|nr:hypothetical protein K461DRAFT_316457 [Myriangium duriaei CBS 260.36]
MSDLNSFPLFSALPREIRDQIWHEALPSSIFPAVRFYSEDCWCLRPILPSDDEYDWACRIGSKHLSEFRHKLLGSSRLTVNIASVNHDAYEVALKWCRAFKEAKFDICTSSLILPFDPHCDAMFVPHERLFAANNGELDFPPGVSQAIGKNHLRHIAVTRTTFVSSSPDVAELFMKAYHRVHTIFVIIDVPQDLQQDDDEHSWELQPISRGSFFWKKDLGRFRLEGSQPDDPDDPYKEEYELIEGAIEELFRLPWDREKYPWGNDPVKEVQPVLAVRR